ncbi:nitrogen fixation protein NifZ [Acidocella sp.]|uniref:nitrogen fixation protein NifZ n=1 Tax=Acidocella sp. TaxID=50710 RepID=UPI00179DE904|nr:nitrogen fixation protein NifZ [Acidocella sp.]NNM57804.1 nitrogen fixation protein NifZ [Acidocella sp.]
MIEPRVPKYGWGQPVLAAEDLFNDGSFPGAEAGAKLVEVSERGEIVNVGTHVDANLPIYLVEFSGNRVVGCLEEEISPV